MQVVGYTYNADTWCADCLPVDDESEDVGAIFETDEWDYDVHCNACHELLLWKYKECSICTNPVYEYQEYQRIARNPINGRYYYIHTNCLEEK